MMKMGNILFPFFIAFSPVLSPFCNVVKKNQTQYSLSKCHVMLNLQKRKFCDKKPRILSQQLTNRVTKYASLHSHDKEDIEKNNSEHAEKKRKREKKTETNQEEQREKKRKKEKKPAPNYFLAVQVTEEEIKQNVREIQKVILEKEKNLSHAMVKTESLHLTLGVYHLEDQDRVAQAVEALDRFHSKLKISNFTPPSLNVSDVGHFKHKVLFASVTEDKGLEDLNTLVKDVRKSLETDGFSTADNRYTPHITISKMSKNMPKLRKLGIKRIEPTHYEEKKTVYFGRQTIESIQLCSMDEPKSESGYYHVEHEIKFQLSNDTEDN
ncbi:A-kinase anchor protein 7-like [Saccostrea echinata]|uniref:A-kinase anchor protein 7-like n=1 Tax=Saccostrea echinata TaxID=191078 RepID=UPI002A7ED5FC|nr:A-kinase anchor protein 7-like [Saccostrea echinata]